MVTLAPAEPAVPDVVTPVVYSLPPPKVPFSVVLNLKGCELFVESDRSNVYV